MNVVMYSAIMGGLDRPRDIRRLKEDGVDCVMFYDGEPDETGWEFRPMPDACRGRDPRLATRYLKANAHLLFPQCDVSVWCDGNLLPRVPVSELISQLGEYDLITPAHPDDANPYVHAHRCMKHGYDGMDCVRAAVRRMRQDGFNEDGLSETGLLVRRHTDRTARTNALWWDMIRETTVRDQVSLQYAVWKCGATLNYLPPQDYDLVEHAAGTRRRGPGPTAQWKSVLMVKDAVPLDGKGIASPETFLRCKTVSILEADPKQCAKYDVIVFHISEDATPYMQAWQALATAIRQIRPDAVIWNEPRCDLGDKLAVDDFVRLHGGIPGVKMPQSWRLNRLEDCDSVTAFPCVVRKPRGAGGAGAILADNHEALRTAAARLGYCPLQAAEFIASGEKTSIAVRLHVIGGSLTDYWAIPSANWNIHARDADWSAAVACDDQFRDWLAAFDTGSLIAGMVRLFGPGWYLLDTVWTGESLWFCEVGYKAADPIRASLFRGHGVRWTVPKASDTPGLVESIISREIVA